MRTCRRPGCTVKIDDRSLACLQHYMEIPKPTRRRLQEAKYIGGPTYQAALREVTQFWKSLQQPATGREGGVMEKTQAAPKRQAKPKAAPPAPPPEVAEEPPFEAGADVEEQREAADPNGEMESSRRKKDMFWMALVMNTVSGEVDMIRFKTPAQMKAWFAENPEWKLRANEIIRGYFKPVVTKQTFTF